MAIIYTDQTRWDTLKQNVYITSSNPQHGLSMDVSPADRHDLDKLAPWYQSLSTGQGGRFPVYALFLVSDEDRAAHDIFRRFRSSFESRGAPFHHLVIFGQHGVSSTVRGLLPEFGLSAGSIPVLVLFTAPPASMVSLLALPPGASGEDEHRWAEVLAVVEEAADKGEETMCLSSVPGLTGCNLDNGTLVESVGGVLRTFS